MAFKSVEDNSIDLSNIFFQSLKTPLYSGFLVTKRSKLGKFIPSPIKILEGVIFP